MMAEQSRGEAGSSTLLRALSLELLIAFHQQGESIETARLSSRASAASRMADYLAQLESEFYTEDSLEEAAARLGMSLRSIAIAKPWLVARGIRKLPVFESIMLASSYGILSEQLPVSPSSVGTATCLAFTGLSSGPKAARQGNFELGLQPISS